MNRIDKLRIKAYEIRRDIIEMIYNAKTGHTGGSLSCVEILTVLYYSILNISPEAPNNVSRDRFILSKGHSVEVLYTILSDKGFFPRKELSTFSMYDSRLIGHPSIYVPGIELNTGALGHGLSCSVGMALGSKKDGVSNKVFCLLGDGELAEGSVWEAALSASHFKLDNLTAIIDRNHLQISGDTEKIMKLERLDEKWRSFGWDVHKIDGNNIEELLDVFLMEPKKDMPRMVIAETIKGKGISFMEGIAKWHHGVPSEKQYYLAMAELNNAIQEIKCHV